VIHVDGSTSRLVITSDETGSTNAITLSDSVGTLMNTAGADETREATDTLGGTVHLDKSKLDAIIEIDGIEITRDNNSPDDVIDGVTLNLLGYQDPTDIPVTLTITPDVESIKEEVNEFITTYNDLLSYLDSQMEVDADNNVRGMLAGSYMFMNLKNAVRTVVTGYVDSVESGNPQLLTEIGIEIDRDGTLTLSDEEAFEDALTDNPKKISDLFNSTNGIAVQVNDLLYDYTKVGGQIDNLEESTNSKIDFIDDRIDRVEERLAKRELELRDEFTELQNALTNLTLQQSFMQQYLGTYLATMG
jgi:flagellar hook-associated protein 2